MPELETSKRRMMTCQHAMARWSGDELRKELLAACGIRLVHAGDWSRCEKKCRKKREKCDPTSQNCLTSLY